MDDVILDSCSYRISTVKLVALFSCLKVEELPLFHVQKGSKGSLVAELKLETVFNSTLLMNFDTGILERFNNNWELSSHYYLKAEGNWVNSIWSSVCLYMRYSVASSLSCFLESFPIYITFQHLVSIINSVLPYWMTEKMINSPKKIQIINFYKRWPNLCRSYLDFALQNSSIAFTLIIKIAQWMRSKFFNRERESRIPTKSLFLFDA